LNAAKLIGAVTFVTATLTREDWVFIISVLMTILGLIQEYINHRDLITTVVKKVGKTSDQVDPSPHDGAGTG
jgi:hypothetical protein